MEALRKIPSNIIGGAIFAVLSVWNFFDFIIALVRYGSWISFGDYLTGYIFPSVSMAVISVSLFLTLFLKIKNPIAEIGIAASGYILWALLQMYYIFSRFNMYVRLGFGESMQFLILHLSIILVCLAAIFLIAIPLFDKENKIGFIKKFFFIPAAVYVFYMFLYIIINIRYYTLLSFLSQTLYTAGLLFAMMWIAYPKIPAQTTTADTYDTAFASGTYDPAAAPRTPAAAVPEGEGYCNLAKHIFLLFLTFGIWYYIWIYKTTAFLNRVEDEGPRNPVANLLLCMFVPYYSIYWTFRSAQGIDKLAKENGVQSGLSVLCLILAIFVGIVPPIIMQAKMNEIAEKKMGPEEKQNSAVAPMQSNIAEELKQYKELLDSGIITQEEFDAKKKQLLGL